MTVIDRVRPLVAVETARLAPTLYEAMSIGLNGARTRMKGIDLAKYPAQFSGLVRVEVREDLERRALPPGWCLAGDPRQMAQLILSNDELNLSLRFLKENRANRGGVPHAGHNQARRAAWAEKPRQLMLEYGELKAKRPARLMHSEPATFLLLWAPNDASDLDKGFTLRVVHTVEAGEHKRGVICDMEVELLQGGEIFDRLEFAGSDEAGDLFEVEIAKENDDE